MNCLNCQQSVEDIENISECEQCNTRIPLCEECEDNNDIYDKYFGDCSYITACVKCNPVDTEEERQMKIEQKRKDEEIRKQNTLINEQKILARMRQQNYWMNEMSKIPMK